jgi:hypothetical protein
LVGDVTFANYGNTGFIGDTELSAKPWAGDTVTIENEAGATWTDFGESDVGHSTFAVIGTAGTAVFINNGTYIENTVSGASFGMAVENNGVMEPVATPYDLNNGAPFALNSVTGTGTIDIGAYVLSVETVGSGQTLNFDAALADGQTPTLDIENPQGFAGTITGFDQAGVNDLIAASTATWAYQDFVANSGGTGGSLMFTNGSAEAAVILTGSYDPLGFHAAVSGSTTAITYSG